MRYIKLNDGHRLLLTPKFRLIFNLPHLHQRHCYHYRIVRFNYRQIREKLYMQPFLHRPLIVLWIYHTMRCHSDFFCQIVKYIFSHCYNLLNLKIERQFSCPSYLFCILGYANWETSLVNVSSIVITIKITITISSIVTDLFNCVLNTTQ